MGLSTNTYTYTGGAQSFPVNFADGFIERSHVTMYRIGDVDGLGNRVYLTFSWNSDSEVLVSTPLSAGDEIVMDRTVPKTEQLVNLADAGALTREGISRNARQALHAVHEVIDGRVDATVLSEDAMNRAIAAAAEAAQSADDAQAAAELAQAAAEIAGNGFDTVADMVAATDLVEGMVVRTNGYTTIGDGGGMAYLVVAAGTGTADGGQYINLTGSGLQAYAVFGKTIHPAAWGCVESTGAVTSRPRWMALIAFLKSRVNDLADPNPYGPTYHVNGGMYALGGTLTINVRSVRINCDFVAATGWGSGTLPLLRFDAAGGYAEFSGMLDCRSLSSGIHIIGGRVEVLNPNVLHMAPVAGSYGVKFGDESGSGGGGGDSWLRGGHVTQWLPDDPEFANEANWTADCIVVDRADCKVDGTTLRWAKRLVYATQNSNTFKLTNSHLINDGASNRVRVNPILIETERMGNVVLVNNYLDNGKCIVRARRFSSQHCQHITLTDRATVDSLYDLYPYADGGYPEYSITNLHRFTATTQMLVDFKNETGFAWGMPTAALEATINAQDFADIQRPSIRARLPVQAAAYGDASDVLLTTAAKGVGAVQKLMDRDTTSQANAPFVRSAGDDLAIGAVNGVVRIEDKNGTTEQITAPRTLLVIGSSGVAGSAGATGGDRTIQPGVSFWDSDTTGGTYTMGTQFRTAAFGTAPFNVGTAPYANSTALQAANALRAITGRNILGMIIAKGGYGQEAFIPDDVLVANGWPRPGTDENMTLHYPAAASAFTAATGKAYADYLLFYQHNNADNGRDFYQPRVKAIIDALIAAGLVNAQTTRIVCIGANPDRTWAMKISVYTALYDLASRNFPNMTFVDQGGIPTFDGTHPSGTGCTWLGARVAGALTSLPNTAANIMLLGDRSNNDLMALGYWQKQNGDTMDIGMVQDVADLRLRFNAQTGAIFNEHTPHGGSKIETFRFGIDGGRLNRAGNGNILDMQADGSTVGSIAIDGSTLVLDLGGGVTVRRGAGSPEGVVTAPRGSTYHRTNGGAGTSFYVKESGTGNTGWVAK